MPEIIETVHIDESPQQLWSQIGSFDAVGEWHPLLADLKSEGEREGALRTAIARDGTRQVERLLENAPEQHFYRYTIESTDLPVRDYVAELRVRKDDDRQSRVEWSARFEVEGDDEAGPTDAVRSFLRAGLDNLTAMNTAQQSSR